MDLTASDDTRLPKRAFLIVHDDDLAAHYMRFVGSALRHPLTVQRGTSADPLELVGEARSLARQAKRQLTRYDEVWCMLGRPPDYTGLQEAATANKVKLALTWPTFETWLLLHHVGVVNSQDHPLVTDPSAARPDPAVAIAAVAGNYVNARHRALNQPSSDGGSTVHELVDTIRESVRAFENLDQAPGEDL
jgi:hypothetical protein